MSTFVGFVLLDEVRFDAEKYVKNLKEDWGMSYDFEITHDNSTIIADNNGMILTASLMPAPIPDNEAIEQAKTNYRWDGAVEAAERHKAHLLVSVINRGDMDNIEGAKHYVKLLANATKQEGCLGINILGTVIHPQMYYDFAKLYDETKIRFFYWRPLHVLSRTSASKLRIAKLLPYECVGTTARAFALCCIVAVRWGSVALKGSFTPCVFIAIKENRH